MKKSSKLSAEQQTRRDELRKAYKALERSPNGRVVLDDLRKLFYDVSLVNDDEHSSSVKVGQHSVVLYINRMIKAGENL